MGMKELTNRMFINFFVIFFLIMLIMSVLSRFWGADTIRLSAVFNFMVLSLLLVLTETVFYSKKELTRLGFLVRHLICLLLVTVITLLFVGFMEVASLNDPSSIVRNVAIVFIVYAISFAIDFFRTAKSANQLTKKLRERYK